MFCNHPDRDSIKFVVLPLIMEKLNTAQDVAMDFKKLISKYSVGSPDSKGLRFDFSMLVSIGNPGLWQASVLTNPAKKQIIEAKMNELGGTTIDDYHDAILSLQQEWRHQRNLHFEDISELYDRAQKIKKFLRRYSNKNNTFKNASKVALVTHCRTI